MVHLHTERANVWFGLVALAARPQRKLRTIHSVFTFEGGLRRRRGFQRRLLRRLGVAHVACGPAVQRNERERFGLETLLVPSWYDSRTFRPATDGERRQARESLGIAADKTVLVTTATCGPVKNHAALLEALARLPARDRPLYLHVGIEEEGYPERRVAESLGLTDDVRFLGPVPDLGPIYAASDLFALPSLYEGFSVAALEALASGLPALFTDVGGLSDLRDVLPRPLLRGAHGGVARRGARRLPRRVARAPAIAQHRLRRRHPERVRHRHRSSALRCDLPRLDGRDRIASGRRES